MEKKDFFGTEFSVCTELFYCMARLVRDSHKDYEGFHIYGDLALDVSFLTRNDTEKEYRLYWVLSRGATLKFDDLDSAIETTRYCHIYGIYRIEKRGEKYYITQMV